MKKLLLFLFILLSFLTAGSAQAQGIFFSGVAQLVNANSSFVQKLGGAQITVCAYAANPVIPCTNTVTIYSDIGDTVVKGNPFFADSEGNFGFFAPAGTYTVTITGIGATGYALTMSGGGASSGGSGNVVGPPTSSPNDIALFNNSTGSLLSDSGVPIASLPLLNGQNLWGGLNEFQQPLTVDDDMLCQNLIPSTSTANQSSCAWGMIGSFWSGSTSLPEDFSSQLVFGTGANPTATEDFVFNFRNLNVGTTGALGVTFSALNPASPVSLSTTGSINSGTGYQVNGAAPLNHCLVGNGIQYVDSTNCSGSLPTLPTTPNTAFLLLTQPSNGASNPAVWSTDGQNVNAQADANYSVVLNPGSTTLSDLGQIITVPATLTRTVTAPTLSGTAPFTTGAFFGVWNTGTASLTPTNAPAQTLTGDNTIPGGWASTWIATTPTNFFVKTFATFDSVLSGDLGGTLGAPTVVGFRGIPLKVGTPTNGQIWIFNSTNNDYELGSASGGGSVTVNGATCTIGSSCNVTQLNDSNGFAALTVTAIASAVNGLNVTDAIAGSAPTFQPQGTDTNIGINLTAKGNGAFSFANSQSSFTMSTGGAITFNPGASLSVNNNGVSSTAVNGSTTASNMLFKLKYGSSAPTGDGLQLQNSSATVLYSVGPNGILGSLNGMPILSAANYTNSTVTASTILTLTLPATSAAKSYQYSCEGMWESTNTTLAGLVLGVNMSAAPTQLTSAAVIQTSVGGATSTGYISNASTGNQTVTTGGAAAVTSTPYKFSIFGTIEGAPTAGATLTITGASTTATTATVAVMRGFACRVGATQ